MLHNDIQEAKTAAEDRASDLSIYILTAPCHRCLPVLRLLSPLKHIALRNWHVRTQHIQAGSGFRVQAATGVLCDCSRCGSAPCKPENFRHGGHRVCNNYWDWIDCVEYILKHMIVAPATEYSACFGSSCLQVIQMHITIMSETRNMYERDKIETR